MNLKAEPILYRKEARIVLYFDYNADDNKRLRQLPGARWSIMLRAWHVPDNVTYREKFDIPVTTVAKISLHKINAINQPAMLKLLEELQLRARSPNTINTYRIEFAQLLCLLKTNHVDALDTETLRSYFLYCMQKLKMTETQVSSRFNAVKFYFDKVLKRPSIFIEIPRPKKPSQLPKVIHALDIKKMLAATQNLKHNIILKLFYGMGLRMSEIVNLKITDIDSKNMQVFIEGVKGKKDRYTMLPESVLHQLSDYYLEYKPKVYLFEGQYGGKYSIRSAQLVFKEALKKAKINKKVGLYSLRHNFVTHLLQAGTDITAIQKLLGLNDIRKTLTYAQVS